MKSEIQNPKSAIVNQQSTIERSEIRNPQSEMERSDIVRVLLVEGDEKDYVFARDLLREASGGPYHLEWATTYETALDAMKRRHYGVCLVDYHLGERDGLSLLREVAEQGCDAEARVPHHQSNDPSNGGATEPR